jgi:alcohol dehydrogenase class IV
MRFEFATSTRIIFGSGTLKAVGLIAAEMGSRAMVVTGGSPDRAETLLADLAAKGVGTTTFAVAGEPTTQIVSDGARQARESNCDLVVSIGGGSAIDAGKAIAALLTNGGEPLDYLEVIGKGQPLTKPPAPYIAIPTTAGTGSEVTKNAVLTSPEHQVKVSLRSNLTLPRLAVVDPELTHSMPPQLTASTGLDALTQVIEPYVSPLANPLTDAICREGMRRGARSLRRAYQNGADADAREDMAITSLFGGLALANAKLGAVHGLAAVIGGMYHAPHGAICGRLLPFVMEANVQALQDREAGNNALRRYDEVAQVLIGTPRASAHDGVSWIRALCATLDVPPLSAHGVKEKDLAPIVEKASQSSSIKGNPVKLTAEEMDEILRQAL